VSDQTTNALLAVALGSVLAVVLLIPVAAVQYRLDGRLGPRDLAILLTAAVYALAIWTYTLLPMPAEGTYHCQGTQLRLFGSLGLIRLPDDGPASLLRDPAFLQIALNVLLFVPLGYFVRLVLHRGVLVATTLGLGVSLLIELTQRTGVWHVYDCAYRLFDVDDLWVNTLGATVGSLVSLLLVRRKRPDVVLPTTISFGRRLMGFVCDVLFVAMLGAAAALAYRGLHLYLLDRPLATLDLDTQSLLQWSVPFTAEALMVLIGGRTVGELVVSTRAVARRPAWTVPSRVVKLATGIGPVFLLAPLDPRPAVGLLAAYALLTVGVAWRTENHRGLSHVLAHLDLHIGDDASEDPDPDPDADLEDALEDR
jgi:glycopeptide antibiotics resistance protein